MDETPSFAHGPGDDDGAWFDEDDGEESLELPSFDEDERQHAVDQDIAVLLHGHTDDAELHSERLILRSSGERLVLDAEQDVEVDASPSSAARPDSEDDVSPSSAITEMRQMAFLGRADEYDLLQLFSGTDHQYLPVIEEKGESTVATPADRGLGERLTLADHESEDGSPDMDLETADQCDLVKQVAKKNKIGQASLATEQRSDPGAEENRQVRSLDCSWLDECEVDDADEPMCLPQAPPAQSSPQQVAEVEKAQRNRSVDEEKAASAAANATRLALLEGLESGKLIEAMAEMAEPEETTDSKEAAVAPEPTAKIEVATVTPIAAAAPVASELAPADPVEVLLCLDASFAMHMPASLAHKTATTSDEEVWDAFSKQLRTREEPCRLDLGLYAVELLSAALAGLAVEVRLCGERPGHVQRSDPLDAPALGQRWRRALLGGADVWRHTAADVCRLQPAGLRTVVVLTGADVDESCSGTDSDDDGQEAPCREAMRLACDFGLPVHVVTLGAPQAAGVGSRVATATGGSCTALPFDADHSDGVGAKPALAGLLQSLRDVPRPWGAPAVPAAASMAIMWFCGAQFIRSLGSARRSLAGRRASQERQAVARIEQAYARWRLRRCLKAAALEAKRARRRAPVEAALRKRQEEEWTAKADIAIRRLQSEWRSRRMRHWCQRVDRASRRLQGWCRRRWLRQRLLREADLLLDDRDQQRARFLRKASTPPPAPSRWPQQPGTWRSTPAEIGTAESSMALAAQAAAAVAGGPTFSSTAPAALVPEPALVAVPPPPAPRTPRGGAGQACAPPSRKPSARPRSRGASQPPQASEVAALTAPPGLLPAPATPSHTGAAHSLRSASAGPGGETTLRSALPRLHRVPQCPRSLRESRSASARASPRRAVDTAVLGRSH